MYKFYKCTMSASTSTSTSASASASASTFELASTSTLDSATALAKLTPTLSAYADTSSLNGPFFASVRSTTNMKSLLSSCAAARLSNVRPSSSVVSQFAPASRRVSTTAGLHTCCGCKQPAGKSAAHLA